MISSFSVKETVEEDAWAGLGAVLRLNTKVGFALVDDEPFADFEEDIYSTLPQN